MKLYFGYDNIIHDGDVTHSRKNYFYNTYENKSVPINGHHIIHETYAYVENTLVKNISNLTVSCQQYPLETILQNNNLSIERDTTINLLLQKKKFVYTIAPKYFVRLNSNYIPGTLRTINGVPCMQYNYIKNLLSAEIIEAINNGNCFFIICDIMECSWYTESLLNTFKSLCREANLNYKKVIILTSNVHNAKNQYIEKSGVNVYYWQYWESAIKHLFRDSKIGIQNNYTSSKYRFLLLNSRPRRHRQYLCYRLWQRDIDFLKKYCVSAEKATLSQLQSCFDYAARDGYKNSITFFDNITEDEKLSYDVFCKMLPLFTPYERGTGQKAALKRLKSDQYISNFNAVTPFFKVNHWNNVCENMIYDTDIHIVTESLMEIKNTANAKHLFFSEKTFKPIAMKAPFIIAAQPGALAYLKECGYRTFNSCWDEEYDNIEDPQQRIDEILNIILSLSQLSPAVYTDIIKRAYEIATYNYSVFIKRLPESQIADIIMSFFNKV